MSGRIGTVVVVCVCLLAARAVGFSQAEPVQVESADLEGRKDLIGREVVVDDHVAFYVERSGKLADELQLKRTGVTFQVPRRLRPASTSRKSCVQVRGVLKRDEGRLVCDVTALTPVPSDIERLEQAVAGLPATDFETRQTWVVWAERRARDFKDGALLKRARKVDADALRIEADVKRLLVDAPQKWLELALDARRRQVPEPGPSALAHRALRAKLSNASAIADVRTVLDAIKSFFPEAELDRDSASTNLANWEAPYANEPAAAYREAPGHIRKALDRRLWADATERLVRSEPTANLQSAIDQAERAGALLPEKPSLATELIEKAAGLARQDLNNARLAEVKALASLYREKLHRPDEGVSVIRDWLKNRTERLSATDAEGRLSLASLYDELLQDRVTAVQLLRKAWRIDSKSTEIAEAFRTRGFHKVKDEWVESTPVIQQSSGAKKGLRGLTPDEVRSEIGSKPNKVSYVASKGQLIEQWIYELDTKMVRYVNLLKTPGDLKPRVIADYQLPRILAKGGPGTIR
jgi:hypothetical protein